MLLTLLTEADKTPVAKITAIYVNGKRIPVDEGTAYLTKCDLLGDIIGFRSDTDMCRFRLKDVNGFEFPVEYKSQEKSQ